MRQLFKIGEKLSGRTRLIIELTGFVFLVFFWWLFTTQGVISESVLPSPVKVLSSYGELAKEKENLVLSEKFIITSEALQGMKGDSIDNAVFDFVKGLEGKEFSSETKLRKELASQLDSTQLDKNAFTVCKHSRVSSVLGVSSLLYNMFYSVFLNILGYIEAITISLIAGFVIALIPFFRGLMSRYIDAIRFVPLAAVTGLFIAWFGIEMNMKVQFLAFGIFVFLLPVVVQRINEVDKIYLQTSYTLGASDWQTIRYVYWPHVLSKLIDDIRVLTAISWTYIIVAEMINREGGGLGALIFLARRFNRLDQVFALLILIIFIGFMQDIFFAWLDKKINPHKYL